MTNHNKITYEQVEGGWLLTSMLDMDEEYSTIIEHPSFKESMGDLIGLKECKGFKVKVSLHETKRPMDWEREVIKYEDGKPIYGLKIVLSVQDARSIKP